MLYYTDKYSIMLEKELGGQTVMVEEIIADFNATIDEGKQFSFNCYVYDHDLYVQYNSEVNAKLKQFYDYVVAEAVSKGFIILGS